MEKYILLILLSLCGNVVSQADDNTVIDQEGSMVVNSTVLCLLQGFDPIAIDLPPFNLNLSETLFSGYINLDGAVSVAGLAKTMIPSLNFAFDGYKVNFTAILPTLEVGVGYDTDSILLTILPIYGNGTARILLNGLELTGYLQIDLTALQLTEFIVKLELDNVAVNINGLVYDEDFSAVASSLVSSLVNSIITPYLNTNAQEISDIISPLLKNTINDIISDLLGSIINGGNSNSEVTMLASVFNEMLLKEMLYK